LNLGSSLPIRAVLGFHRQPPCWWPGGGVSDLDLVILNLVDSQHVNALYIHIRNTTLFSMRHAAYRAFPG